MSTLGNLVATSEAVRSTRSRNAKAEHIASWLRSLGPESRRIGASYMAGIVPQGRTGVGRTALSAVREVASSSASSLTLLDVDRTFTGLQNESGAGSTKRRSDRLGALFARATASERDFLLGLLTGSLRQGSGAGVLVEGIARATETTAAQVRHASMVAGDIAEVAARALEGGAAALASFRMTLFRPLEPMLASPESGGFVMLGKTFKGMTDKVLGWQTEQLLAREVARDGHVVHVRPELVVEVAFGGVLASPTYPGGLALRFARLRNYREDKAAEDADTLEAVRAIFDLT